MEVDFPHKTCLGSFNFCYELQPLKFECLEFALVISAAIVVLSLFPVDKFIRFMKADSVIRYHFSFLAWILLPVAFLGCKTTDLTTGYIPPARLPEQEERFSAPAFAAPIAAGDTLELFVEEDDSFNGTYSVRERGDIFIPSVGRIPVRGMSVTDAGARIRSKLEATHLKTASVMLDRVGRSRGRGSEDGRPEPSGSIRVYMTGKVERPGQHRVPLSESGSLGVYEAILIAGGISDFGDSQKVHILRSDETGTRQKIPVNIRNIEKGLAKDPPIGDGDIVVVPEKIFGF